ncbi:MAG: ferrous iron transport protein B [Spirochaetales bacterium]|nr:ferrous iron transport protein B [Spirochaetales bacterium]
MTVTSEKTRIIALAGQPNTGKSTLFNRLTGAKQHVGNWPGKTVEQKSGNFVIGDRPYQLVDLPGTYSLTANSIEEKIARDFIVDEQPDVVVIMADASQLERSLYLLAEIKLLNVPSVLALNMMDVAEEQGKDINVEELEKGLGIKVLPLVAAKGEGVLEFLSAIEAVADKEIKTDTKADSIFKDDKLFNSVKSVITGKINSIFPEDWMVIKLIEGDAEVYGEIQQKISSQEWNKLFTLLNSVEDGQLHAAGLRYEWISNVLSKAVKKQEAVEKKSRGKRFDKIATHPVWGKVLAVLIMLFSFGAAMIVALPVMGGMQPLGKFLVSAVNSGLTSAPQWFVSLLADGLIPGVSVAIMMLGYIFGVYLVFSLLEDVGYVARLAYIFDNSMTKLGLHGKSFMPLLMSFGCNIAGVTGTRVIDTWQQRMVTLVMVSIVPCAALWAVISFIGTIFFSAAMPFIILILLVIMVLHLSLTSYLLRKFVVPGETSGLIMELPPYHKPNWKTIFGHVWVQVKSFFKRAVSLIAILSVVTWALSYRADGNMDLSILASIGKFFDPVTSFLGLDWRLFIALCAAMIAKEAALSVIAVLYGIGGATSITSFLLGGAAAGHAELASTIGSMVNPASALAFIFAFFFTVPCIGTVASIYSESKSLKWTFGSSLYYIVTSLIAGGIAYRVGLLIF